MQNSNRRYRPHKAAERLEELGAPRSIHTLRKDHAYRSGERGPSWLRDAKGNHWYREEDLVAWGQTEWAKLSPNNPPQPRPCHLDTAAAEDLKV